MVSLTLHSKHITELRKCCYKGYVAIYGYYNNVYIRHCVPYTMSKRGILRALLITILTQP